MAVKKSLFVQVAWFDETELNTQLEHVRQYHKDPAQDDYIYNLVMDEVGTPYALHHQKLDVIMPYLAGPRKTFDNVFVGSNFLRYNGKGSSYKEGMADGVHRWNNLVNQKVIWGMFRDRYPTVPFHFYINHEGVLDFFDDRAVANGYEAYLIQSVRDSHDIYPNRAVLWSPAVWSGASLTMQEQQSVAQVFQNVKFYAGKWGHRYGVNWLHLQDMMGRGRSDVTRYDVEMWYRQLKRAYKFDSLRVNMEMFNLSGPVDKQELAEREDWYGRKNIPLGSSWSLQHWYHTHQCRGAR